MFRALMQQPLNLEDIAAACVRASLDSESGILSDGVRDSLQCFENGFCLVLLSQIQKPEAHGEEVTQRAVQSTINSLPLHQALEDRLRNLVIAGSHVDHAQGKRCHYRTLERGTSVHDDRGQILHQILTLKASVGKSKTDNGSQLLKRLVRLQVLAKQSPCRVAFVVDTASDHAKRHQRSGLDVLLRRPLELVDLRQTIINVPQQKHPQRRRSTHHTMLLVLVQPSAAFDEHQLVIAEPCIYERICECAGQVLLG
mmetsp:Transcript_82/g.219  ORF Transcript_82/g.219 Transcript_82/m.219 type:complete len:255 (-) Transcript_82:1139-1903(-)